MTKEKLKNCPFCGAYATANSEGFVGNDGKYIQFQYIECSECGSEINDRKAWNTRATTAREQKLVDALEWIIENVWVYPSDSIKDKARQALAAHKQIEKQTT